MAFFRFVLFGVLAVLLVNGQKDDGQNENGQKDDGPKGDGKKDDGKLNLQELIGDKLSESEQLKYKLGVNIEQNLLDTAFKQLADVPGGNGVVQLAKDELRNKTDKPTIQADIDAIKTEFEADKKALKEKQKARAEQAGF